MTDLESQLCASLPGRPTEVQDYAALWVARAQVEQAARLLADARSAVAVVLGDGRAAVTQCQEATVLCAKIKLDLERAIKAHPAGKAPR